MTCGTRWVMMTTCPTATRESGGKSTTQVIFWETGDLLRTEQVVSDRDGLLQMLEKTSMNRYPQYRRER